MALVGGFAVSARAEPRFTRDIDVAVMVSGDAAEGLVRTLLANGYQLVASVEHDASGRLATARLASVARAGHLIAVKVLARDDETRPQDLADLRALLAVATNDDLELAHDGIDLITQRGVHRDRDLAAALAQLCGERQPHHVERTFEVPLATAT